jgi:HlyD family secretion protein
MKKSNIRRIIAGICISAIALSATTGCGSAKNEGGFTYDTYKIEKTDLENYISVSGAVEGSNIVKVTSDLAAKVAELKVELGSNVKAGDVLCVFDSSDLQSEYDALKSSMDKNGEKIESAHQINQRNLTNAKNEKQNALSQAQKAIDRAVSARDSAYNKYNSLVASANDYYSKYIESYNKAYSEGGTENDIAVYESYLKMFQSAEAEYKALAEQLSTYDAAVQDARDAYTQTERTADASIQAAQDVVNAEKFDSDDSAKTQLDKLQEKINKCTVVAPKDGVITAIDVAEGSFPAKESIMTIEDTSQLRIKVEIKETDILNIKEGQKAVITTNATGDKEFTGTVDRVLNIMSDSINPYTGEKNGGYSAEIAIDDSDTSLLIGMNAKVKIIIEEKNDVFAVPYNSIVENKDGTFSVVVAEGTPGNYTAKHVNVEKGMEANYLTEITSSEIKEDTLILTDPDYVSDGDSLRLSDGYYDAVKTEGVSE